MAVFGPVFGDTGSASNRTRWVGEWALDEQYRKNDFGKEGQYAGVALVDTTDHIAPQYTGPEAYYFAGTLVDNTALLKQVLLGTRYHFQSDREVSGYRVYAHEGQHYVVWLVRDPLGVPVFDVLLDFVAVRDGWQEVAVDPTIVSSGTVFDLLVQINEPDPTPTTWVGTWNYQTPNNAGIPAAGDISHATKAIDQLRINKTDDNGGDRSTELEALTVGDLISGAGVNWSIQAVVDNGTYMTFSIAPQTQGTAGIQEFTFSTVTATPITYGEDVDYYLGDANVDGLYSVTGSYDDITSTDTAFGADILTQPIEFSDDWDLLPTGVSSQSSRLPNDPYGAVYRSEPFVGPITVTEDGPPQTLQTLVIDPPEPGVYLAQFNFTSQFTAANDQLIWAIRGTYDTGQSFLVESKDADEIVPFSFSTTLDLNGSPVSVEIEADVEGPGAADVIVTAASISFIRVQ